MLEIALAVLREMLDRGQAAPVPVRIPLPGEARITGGYAEEHVLPELFIQVSGACAFQAGKRPFRLEAGELCVMPRQVLHAECPVATEQTPYYNLTICPRLDHLAIYLGEGGEQARVTIRRVPLELHGDPTLLALTVAVLDAVAGKPLESEPLKAGAQSLLKGVCLSLVAALERRSASDCLPPGGRIAHCRRLISYNLHDRDLALRMLADKLNCCPGNLSSQFRRETGESLTAYIHRQRIDQARNLLRFRPTWSLESIARACGFASLTYFDRIFKRHCGTSPGEYRKSLKGEG
jgi:AraC-like DNA-binding protein